MDNTDMLEANVETFGGSVSYLAPGAEEAITVPVIWSEAPPMTPYDSDGQTIHRTARALVRTSDLAAPVRGATVTCNSEAWTVRIVRPRGTEGNELELTRSEIIERSSENYRRRR